MHQYAVIYKPFNVLSQFTSQEGKQTLKDLFKVPNTLYPVGRLDFDSEGLLILTDDTSLNHRLLDPKFAHERAYWVQLDGDISDTALHQLESGVVLNFDGKAYKTRPARVEKMQTPPIVPERNPPIRYRAQIPTSWIKLTLTEGKNRQVRKMTAKVGFPTLRLIRCRIGGLSVEGWKSGEMRFMQQQEIFPLLFPRSG